MNTLINRRLFIIIVILVTLMVGSASVTASAAEKKWNYNHSYTVGVPNGGWVGITVKFFWKEGYTDNTAKKTRTFNNTSYYILSIYRNPFTGNIMNKLTFTSKHKLFCIAVILIATAIAAILLILMSVASPNLETNIGEGNRGYAKILYEQIKLQKELGVKSAFVELYTTEQGTELQGRTKDSSIDYSVNYLLEREALFYYATSLGYRVTNNDVNNEIEKEISEMKASENYDEIVKACEAEDVSFEDTVYANYVTRESDMTIDMLYADEYAKFLADRSISVISLDPNVKSEWNNYMNVITETALDVFNNTPEYKRVNEILKIGIDVIRNNDSVLEAVRGKDVYKTSFHDSI